MTKDGGSVKRFGGRWIREGDQYKERFRRLRPVMSRFWYLLIPIGGIMWAQASYVRPDLEDIKSIKNRERAELLDQKDGLRSDISVIQTQIQEVSAEIDTLHLPESKYYQSVYDSLLQIRSVYDETLPPTKARIDSLRAAADEIAAELAGLSETFRDRSSMLDDLRAWHATLIDSIEVLDQRITLKTDDLCRLQYPLEYRRKDALFTGEGEYPQRDENPPREGGE